VALQVAALRKVRTEAGLVQALRVRASRCSAAERRWEEMLAEAPAMAAMAARPTTTARALLWTEGRLALARSIPCKAKRR
jgi:hypothetical protein